jgi:hypothetical protein
MREYKEGIGLSVSRLYYPLPVAHGGIEHMMSCNLKNYSSIKIVTVAGNAI